MKTMQPMLKRGRDVWDQINMPEIEFQERVKKIRDEMKKEGIDILLVYGNAPDEYGNPCYISNYLAKSHGVLVTVAQEDLAVIFEGSSRDLPEAKSRTWIEQVRPCGDISKECIEHLKERSLIPSTIGFVGLRQLMPYYQLQPLYESLRECKIVDASHILRDMRVAKSERECDQIRRASRILAHAFNLISDIPLNERIIEATVDREARLEGAEDFRMLIAKPLEERWAFRPTENAPILTGDSIIIYLAAEYEGYWSEGIRTFVAEFPYLVQPEFGSAKALYERIMDGMKLGKTLSQFYKETMSELEKSQVGYIPEYGLGQGIGLSLQEFPMISEEDVSQFREGLCLTLRLAMKDKDTGAIMIGNTIHLSKNRPEVLTE